MDFSSCGLFLFSLAARISLGDRAGCISSAGSSARYYWLTCRMPLSLQFRFIVCELVVASKAVGCITSFFGIFCRCCWNCLGIKNKPSMSDQHINVLSKFCRFLGTALSVIAPVASAGWWGLFWGKRKEKVWILRVCVENNLVSSHIPSSSAQSKRTAQSMESSLDDPYPIHVNFLLRLPIHSCHCCKMLFLIKSVFRPYVEYSVHDFGTGA